MNKRIYIEGMSCNHCVMHVKNALLENIKIKEVEVSLEGKYAKIIINEEISKEEIVKIITDLGYEVKEIV